MKPLRRDCRRWCYTATPPPSGLRDALDSVSHHLDQEPPTLLTDIILGHGDNKAIPSIPKPSPRDPAPDMARMPAIPSLRDRYPPSPRMAASDSKKAAPMYIPVVAREELFSTRDSASMP